MCMAEKECFGAAPGEKSLASREGLFAMRAGIISSYMKQLQLFLEEPGTSALPVCLPEKRAAIPAGA